LSIGKVLLLGRIRPYQQTLELAGKASQEQTLWLIMKTCKLWTRKFYNIEPKYYKFYKIFATEKLHLVQTISSRVGRINDSKLKFIFRGENGKKLLRNDIF